MPKSAFETHVYKHPWPEISYAVWRKYPNPTRPDVLSVDILDRSIDPDTGVLRTRRMVTMKGPLPGWMEKMIGRASTCHFVEDSEIDPKSQTMHLKSRNVTLDQVLLMEESCSYSAHENGEWTDMQLEGKVTSFSFGIASKVEDFLSSTYKQNASKGRIIMEQAMEKVKAEAAEKIAVAEKFGRSIKHEAEELVHSIKAHSAEEFERIKHNIEHKTEELGSQLERIKHTITPGEGAAAAKHDSQAHKPSPLHEDAPRNS